MKPTAETSESEASQPLELAGSPYQRGLIHGETLKAPIHDLVYLWKDDLRKGFGKDPDELIHLFLQETDFIPAIQRWTPDLLEEIKGIADGSGVDFDTMLAFQFLDELWLNLELILKEHCSSLGFSAEGPEPTYLAQNMDIEEFHDGFQVLMHIQQPDTHLESLVLSFAGLIGLNGMNDQAIGICCNAEFQLNYAREGLPVAFVVRGVLQQRTEADAIDFLKGIKHASGQNYLIGGPQRVYDFECSSSQAVQYKPKRHEKTIWHSNHPLVSHDYAPSYQAMLEAGSGPMVTPNSAARFQSLTRQLGGELNSNRLEHIKEVLTSKDSKEHPICGSKSEGEFYHSIGLFTFASTIMVLSESPEFHVSFGPPDKFPYQKFSLGR
jgi:isopenicillin-N N-acyltransferase-like protein